MMPVQACSICGGAIVGFDNDACREAEREGGNGGALQMIDLNDIEEDSFFAIQAADLRWLYDLWAQLADESRPLDRQAIAKRLADVLENAEFF